MLLFFSTWRNFKRQKLWTAGPRRTPGPIPGGSPSAPSTAIRQSRALIAACRLLNCICHSCCRLKSAAVTLSALGAAREVHLNAWPSYVVVDVSYLTLFTVVASPVPIGCTRCATFGLDDEPCPAVTYSAQDPPGKKIRLLDQNDAVSSPVWRIGTGPAGCPTLALPSGPFVRTSPPRFSVGGVGPAGGAGRNVVMIQAPGLCASVFRVSDC